MALTDEKQACGGGGCVLNVASAEFSKVSVLCRLELVTVSCCLLVDGILFLPVGVCGKINRIP